MKFTAVIEALPEPVFRDMYRGISRKVRNLLEGRLLPRRSGAGVFSLKADTPDSRIPEVKRAVVRSGKQELAEELLKAYLIERRPMLKIALDAVGVPNDDGLTDHELDPIRDADAATVGGIVDEIVKRFPASDAALYFAFLGNRASLDVPTLRSVWADWGTLALVEGAFDA